MAEVVGYALLTQANTTCTVERWRLYVVIFKVIVLILGSIQVLARLGNSVALRSFNMWELTASASSIAFSRLVRICRALPVGEVLFRAQLSDLLWAGLTKLRVFSLHRGHGHSICWCMWTLLPHCGIVLWFKASGEIIPFGLIRKRSEFIFRNFLWDCFHRVRLAHFGYDIDLRFPASRRRYCIWRFIWIDLLELFRVEILHGRDTGVDVMRIVFVLYWLNH